MRDPCPSITVVCMQNSCIPSILIDPESMGFPTIERYQRPVAFGSLDICNNSNYNAGMHYQVLTLLAG